MERSISSRFPFVPLSGAFPMSRTRGKFSVCRPSAVLRLRQGVLPIAMTAVMGVSSAAAGTVELSLGGHVAGRVARVDQSSRPYVVVRVDEDVRVALPESRVRRVVSSDELAEYRRHVVAAGQDAEKHYELARWCSANSLLAQSRHHMQRAIQLDPDHSEARAALGYVEHRGEWVRYDHLQRSRGLVSVSGRWQLPEAVALERARKQAEVRAKRWIKEVARTRAMALRGNAEALQELEAIEDPLAAAAIAQELNESRGSGNQPRRLRLLWVELLSRFHNATATRALVRAGVEESDSVVREAALEQLQEYGRSSAVATYLPMLQSNSNEQVNRAARALSFFPDRELALTYVDALVTTHKKVIPAGPGYQAGFSSDGDQAFSTGGKPRVIQKSVENPPVLALLKTVEPEANYGYDEAAWRQHFARKLTSYDGDLRRDP